MNNSRIFKVDRIYVDSPPGRLLIANYNIPIDRLNQASIVQVFDAISRDFAPDYGRVMFALTATYLLRHKHTGEIKFFAGSFHPRGISFNQLAAFRPLNSVVFVPFVMERTDVEDIKDSLQRFAPDSAWAFDQLVSVVVNTQARVDSNHLTLPSRSALD